MAHLHHWEGWRPARWLSSDGGGRDVMVTSREVAAVGWSSAVSLLWLRKLLWRSKSQSKLYSIVVLVDHDGVECAIRSVGRGRGEAKLAGRGAACSGGAGERPGGSSAAHHFSIVFTPGFFLRLEATSLGPSRFCACV